MGSCISSPGKTFPRKSSKEPITKPSPPRNNQHDHYNYDPPTPTTTRRSSVASMRPPINVITSPSPGNIFDKYQLGKELGRGEFGVTHRCVDLKSGEAFACKKIAKTKLRTEIDIADVRREVQIMRHLPKHPNIV